VRRHPSRHRRGRQADRRGNATIRTEQERGNAERALDLGDRLRDRTLAVDAALQDVFAHCEALRAIAIELSATISTRLQLEPMLATSERHTFTELAERWSETVTTFAKQRAA
jgi:hypothetical protein